MYEVKITKIAEEDLLEVVRYISGNLKSPSAAIELMDLIEQELKKLQGSPFTCRLVHDEYLKDKGIRFLQVKNHLAFYRVREDKKEVSVIRILFARRDWNHLLEATVTED